MGDPQFWKMALAVAAPVCFYYGFRNWRLARLIDDTPLSRIRSAAQGYVELAGTARQADGQLILGPLTRLPCVWWQFRIEHHTGLGRNRRWTTVNQGGSTVPFRLEDDTGACLVDPSGADVRPGTTISWRGSSPWPIPPGEGHRFTGLDGDDYRYTEHRIDEQVYVHVIGDFRTVGGIEATDVTGEVMRLLSDWKQDQPALLRRFDADHNGILSQTEWESARALARAQIEQRPPTQPKSPANMVVRPQDNRPFLVAACDLRALARRCRWAAGALLAGFLVAVGVLGFLVSGPA
jgi:E3 Ubiquitin ligase